MCENFRVNGHGKCDKEFIFIVRSYRCKCSTLKNYALSISEFLKPLL